MLQRIRTRQESNFSFNLTATSGGISTRVYRNENFLFLYYASPRYGWVYPLQQGNI